MNIRSFGVNNKHHDTSSEHSLSASQSAIVFLCLTCVLPELVHGLEVDNVGREAAVHLAQDHAASTGVAAPNGRLDLVGHCGAVGPPPAVLVQPFPHHYCGGHEHAVTAGPGREIQSLK